MRRVLILAFLAAIAAALGCCKDRDSKGKARDKTVEPSDVSARDAGVAPDATPDADTDLLRRSDTDEGPDIEVPALIKE